MHLPMNRRLRASAWLCLFAPLAAWAQTATNPPLGDCIASLRRELPAYPKVSPATFDTHTRSVQDLRPAVDTATRTQPEFKLSIWDYVAKLADDQRVAEGRAVLLRESAGLAAIEQAHRVEPTTVVSVLGVETDYGKIPGKYPVVDATLSRACLNLDSKERKAHFFAALQLLQEGAVKPEQFRGSWAGAFGMTQFMPGTFLRFMDQPDGQGKVDIVNSMHDALATTARFLVSLGWTAGLRWGVEVKAPAALVASVNALEGDHRCLTPSEGPRCRSVEQWAAQGVVRVDGRPLAANDLPASTRGALLAPAGPSGPIWLITRNFQALWGYNRADAYALAIGLLSDSLRGEPPMKAAWPTDDPGISRAEFKEVQALLVALGHAGVTPDGYDGPKTRDAIRDVERRLGLAETGRAGAKILRLLRTDVSAVKPAQAGDSAASGPTR